MTTRKNARDVVIQRIVGVYEASSEAEKMQIWKALKSLAFNSEDQGKKLDQIPVGKQSKRLDKL